MWIFSPQSHNNQRIHLYWRHHRHKISKYMDALCHFSCAKEVFRRYRCPPRDTDRRNHWDAPIQYLSEGQAGGELSYRGSHAVMTTCSINTYKQTRGCLRLLAFFMCCSTTNSEFFVHVGVDSCFTLHGDDGVCFRYLNEREPH